MFRTAKLGYIYSTEQYVNKFTRAFSHTDALPMVSTAEIFLKRALEKSLTINEIS
jgi:hypothetical protein